MREKIFTKINGRSKTLQRNVKVGDNLQRGQGCFVLVKDSWCHGQKFFDAKTPLSLVFGKNLEFLE